MSAQSPLTIFNKITGKKISSKSEFEKIIAQLKEKPIFVLQEDFRNINPWEISHPLKLTKDGKQTFPYKSILSVENDTIVKTDCNNRQSHKIYMWQDNPLIDGTGKIKTKVIHNALPEVDNTSLTEQIVGKTAEFTFI